MERKTFVFYKDWKKAIEDLPDDIRLEIYESIIEYATSGSLQGLKPMAKIAFNFIKTDIDRDTEKYMSIKQRNKSNGLNGGRPNNKTQDNPDNPVGFNKTQNNPNNLVNVNDNVNVNVNDNDKKNKIINDFEKKDFPDSEILVENLPIDQKEKEKSSAKKEKKTVEERKEEFYKEVAAYSTSYEKTMLRNFFDYWTEIGKNERLMRFEKEKTFEVKKRLERWKNNQMSTSGQKKSFSERNREITLNALKLLQDERNS